MDSGTINPLSVDRRPWTMNRYTEKIDVLELLIQTLDDTLNQAIDHVQIIDNLLYVKKLNLKEYIKIKRVQDSIQ